ncbi:MAG: hypothetical protein GXO47_08745 [Chlorobi bacterium]|nr:hypothetical protein [Chlorobiota bacterium]
MMQNLIAEAQESVNSGRFWVQRYLHGEVSLKGLWRQQESYYPNSYEDWQSLYGIGGIKLLSGSYFWMPEVMTLDLDLEFNPETRKEKYIQIPDRNETRTLSKIGIRSTLLSKKPVSFSPFYTYNYSYFNRENLTNVRSKTQNWGGRVVFNNKTVPVTLSYNDLYWRQKETETGLLYTNRRKTLEGRSVWHIFEKDRNEFVYGYDDYTYTYTVSDTTHNTVNRFSLNNQFYLDSANNYSFNSFINFFDQTGTYTFRRFEVNERLSFNLPYNFRLKMHYNYYSLKDLQKLKQNRATIDFSHKLYESLRTYVHGSYSNTNQTVYDETNLRIGAGFEYSKKIREWGRLNINYGYYRNNTDVKSDSRPVTVINETHSLTDGVPALLDRPYVDMFSVVVKDISGTIIYRLNLDYILIERNNYVEIQRIIGGQIPNGGDVMVDYIAVQPGDYGYDLNNHRIYTGVVFFHRLFEIYYRGGFQDYTNVKQSGFITLKYYHQNIAGIRIEKSFFRGGIEYDHFDSNIIPYRMMRYYLNLQKNFRYKLFLTLNASLRDYTYIEDDQEQLLGNVTAMASYNLRQRSKLELETGYLKHKVYMTNLNLWTGRLKYTTFYRQLYFEAGFDFYSRNYTENRFTMNGVFVKLTRKF